MRPDYGIRRKQEGISQDVDISFSDFRLFSLSVLGQGRYSTMVEMPYAGEVFALSLDFDGPQLAQILAKATPQLAAYIREALAHDPASHRTIDFEGEIAFAVRARLGEIQKGKMEAFVPLVCHEIL